MTSLRRRSDSTELVSDPFERICNAMKRVDRAAFVPANLTPYARSEAALPIGYGKTLSKPSTVAFMLSAVEISPGFQVLEVGSGSGYVLAVLAELGARVHGMENIPSLAQSARKRLDRLGYPGVLLKCGDGKSGWPDYAPFDAILVSAAMLGEVPRALLDQLKSGGTLIAPVAVKAGADGIMQRFEIWTALQEADGTRRYLGESAGECEFVLAD